MKKLTKHQQLARHVIESLEGLHGAKNKEIALALITEASYQCIETWDCDLNIRMMQTPEFKSFLTLGQQEVYEGNEPSCQTAKP